MMDEQREFTRPLVPPMVLLGGEVEPRHSGLGVETLLVLAADRPPVEVGTTQQIRDLLEVVTRPQAVAEVAWALNLPMRLVMVLASQLIDAGQIRVCSQATVTDNTARPTIDLLERVLSGLRNL